MRSAISFLAFFSCVSLVEIKSLQAGETCVGIRREDSSYDFELPDAVAVNAQDPACDAEWTLDQFTAILDRRIAHFSHPFKNVTNRGISVTYCAALVKCHISCPTYTNHLTCSCTNFTSNPVLNTKLPDMSSDANNSDSSVRQHYCAVAVAATFALSLVILAVLICRTQQQCKI